MENWAGVLTEVSNLQFEKLKKKIMLMGGQIEKMYEIARRRRANFLNILYKGPKKYF